MSQNFPSPIQVLSTFISSDVPDNQYEHDKLVKGKAPHKTYCPRETLTPKENPTQTDQVHKKATKQILIITSPIPRVLKLNKYLSTPKSHHIASQRIRSSTNQTTTNPPLFPSSFPRRGPHPSDSPAHLSRDLC